MHVILTHENADFDAIASLLGAHKLYPAAIPVLPQNINRNAAGFISLYRNGLPFMTREQWKRRKVSRVTLVDTHTLPSLRGLQPETPVEIIDHHPPPPLRPGDTFSGEVLGANTTLLVERLAETRIAINSLEATLLALGVYEDTGSFTFSRTTPRDLQAGVWLLTNGAAIDTVRRFLEVPLNDDQLALYRRLLSSAESRMLHGHTVIVCAAAVESPVAEISRVVSRLSSTLDPSGLFTLVQTPNGTHIICRSSTDDIDVGAVAQAFGGGGHTRASAATVASGSLQALTDDVWRLAELHIRPAVRVGQLMSYGVQTVDAERPLSDVVTQLRRIGHEGYPVVEQGKLIGLLTRRDADRASEHGLGSLRVRDVMQSGTTTLSPDDSIYALEQTMLQTGWGQVPVADAQGKLLGIVTRTDLIKFWAQTHPREYAPPVRVTNEQIEQTLGASAARLIARLAEIAQSRQTAVYMVGGCVRDLMLRRRNLDIDFVVEGDAIAFAQLVRDELGGQISSFRPFGTAKWSPDEGSRSRLDAEQLPDHIDFATARNEFYEHPTALPTVYSGSIKLDLQRRDFTINTLAVQISPTFGTLLDPYGGLSDLENGQIRVLHSLSFIDDPTRILRAVRFEKRLGFTIEPRTEALLPPALPMLGRITGERVRNELTLLLQESSPEEALLSLEARGVLTAIHPAFHFGPETAERFRRTRDFARSAPDIGIAFPAVYWHLIALGLPEESVQSWALRLLFSEGTAAALETTRRVQPSITSWCAQKPSDITRELEALEEMTLHALAGSGSPENQACVLRYLREWRHVRPATDGHALKSRGLPPGPCYAALLKRLRAAWLDGEVQGKTEEKALLDRLLEEGFCDDHIS